MPDFSGWGPTRSWPPGGYYEEGWWLARNPGFRGRIGANHRMISTYLNLLVRHRLDVDEAGTTRSAMLSGVLGG